MHILLSVNFSKCILISPGAVAISRSETFTYLTTVGLSLSFIMTVIGGFSQLVGGLSS